MNLVIIPPRLPASCANNLPVRGERAKNGVFLAYSRIKPATSIGLVVEAVTSLSL